MFLTLFNLPAQASYIPFNTKVPMNIGIGTSAPGSSLSVLGGESLGAYATNAAPAGGIITSGNVGIGSSAPGQALDVQGTVRATMFAGNGSQLTGLMASTLWSNTNTNDVYLRNNGNVGIGTTITNAGAALSIMNGNVGIGTWVPGALLDIGGYGAPSQVTNMVVGIGANSNNTAGFEMRNSSSGVAAEFRFDVVDDQKHNYLAFDMPSSTNSAVNIFGLARNTSAFLITNSLTGGTGRNLAIGPYAANNLILGTNNAERMRIDSNGNIGIGTNNPFGGQLVIASGNVGIGLLTPGQSLDVIGTVRATAFIGNGAQLTGLPSSGLWTTTNTNDVYLPNNGNVGIGTTITNGGAALSIMNGNVGIGTWGPSQLLAVGAGNKFTVDSSGDVVAGGSVSSSNSGNSYISGRLSLGTSVAPTSTLELMISGSEGHVWGAPIPTLSSCGTSPTIKGTDNAFQITVGSTASGCTATFAGTYSDATCVVTNETPSLVNAMTYIVSSSAVTITQTSLSGDVIDAHCDFKN